MNDPRGTVNEPLRMTLTKNGEPCSITFVEVTRDWWVSDCKRYAIAVTYGLSLPGSHPFGAYVRPLHDAKDKDGHRPMAESLGFFEHMKGRDSAIAACIRHKREHSTEPTTQQQELTV